MKRRTILKSVAGLFSGFAMGVSAREVDDGAPRYECVMKKPKPVDAAAESDFTPAHNPETQTIVIKGEFDF